MVEPLPAATLRRIKLAARRERQLNRVARFTPIPFKRRRSTRGQYGEPWRTKAWTASRIERRTDDLRGARPTPHVVSLTEKFLWAGMGSLANG